MDVEDAIELEADSSGHDLIGRRIAFYGKLEALNRRDVCEFVRRRGALPVDDAQEADVLVVGTDELPLEDLDSFINQGLLAAAASGNLEIVSESKFWQMAGMIEPDSHVKRLYTAAMLARLLNVPLATIRRWHRRGLITPARQVHRLAYYDFQEVATARRLGQLIQSGASPAKIESQLSQLADWFPDVQRPLTQLSIIVEGQDVLLRQGQGLIEPNGQRRIDFDSLESTGAESDQTLRVVSPDRFPMRPPLVTPEDHQRLANELEDEGRLVEALQVYRGMLLAFGPKADVNFSIAEVLYLMGEPAAARERYLMAIELDESFVEARASLGCLLIEMNETELALSVFEGALEIHTDYADVHFHMARRSG